MNYWKKVTLIRLQLNSKLHNLIQSKHSKRGRLGKPYPCGEVCIKERGLHLPTDGEAKAVTICGEAKASSLFFSASRCTHFSE